jgi:hypothetical protein
MLHSAGLGLAIPIPIPPLILTPATIPLILPLIALLIVLPHDGITRLVTVTILLKLTLPLHLSGILIPGILTLVAGQRGRCGGSAAVPFVPAASTLFPVAAPVFMPAWRRIRPPPAEIGRWLAVVAHRDAQDVYRYRI